MKQLPERLASLDILRGLTLFFLVFLQPVACALLPFSDSGWAQFLLYQLDHEVWEGFRFWDLIMPLFLFMSGTSIPFSFSKLQKNGFTKAAIYRKVLRRVAILFLLGMVVQGNLLGFNPDAIYIYTNTLQAIAVGYLIASVVVLECSRWPWGQAAAVAVLLLGYSLPMMVCGDYTPEGNLANQIDACVLGRFRGDPSYTWVLSSLTFGVTVVIGSLAGQIIKQGKHARRQTLVRLLVFGLAVLLAGLLWSGSMPIVKRLWTGSMALFSGGLCILLLALFYAWVDILGHRRGLEWLKIYGMNSIAAYMLGEVVNFRSAVESLSYGLAPLLGEAYGAWLTFGNFAIVFLILYCMYRSRYFLKV